MSLTWLALLLHAGAVLLRGLAVDRPPWGNMYEFATAGAVVVTGVFLVACLRKDLRFLGLFITGPVLLTLGLAVSVLYTQAGQLVPALKSYWLAIHVSIAFISSALLVLAFSATVLYLVQASRETRRAAGTEVGGNFMDALPSAAELDQAAYRLHAIAFPLWTFTIVAGRDLGRERLGPLLGLGPQGGLVVRHLGDLRGLPARPGDPRLGPAQGGVHRLCGVRGAAVQLPGRQHLHRRPALLRRGQLSPAEPVA